MPNTIVSALAALSLAAFVTPASAETVSINVDYADLNLSTPEGMAALHGRIRAAVNRICGNAPVISGVVRKAAERRCVEQATASARAEVARITRNIPTVALSR